MTDKQAVPLLPCPFCGWHDVRHVQKALNDSVRRHWPQCSRCRCRLDDYKAPIPDPEPWRAESTVSDKWNTRATPSARITREALREALDDGTDIWSIDDIIDALRRLGIEVQP